MEIRIGTFTVYLPTFNIICVPQKKRKSYRSGMRMSRPTVNDYRIF